MSIFSKFDDVRNAFAALANAGRDLFGVHFDKIARDLDSVAIVDFIMDIEDHWTFRFRSTGSPTSRR